MPAPEIEPWPPTTRLEALESGDEDGARALFREAADLDPTYELPVRGLTTLAVKADDWAEAGRAAEELLVFAPDDVAVMGTVYTAAVKTFDIERLEPAARRLALADPGTLDNMVEVAVWMFEADKLEAAQDRLIVRTRAGYYADP